MEGSEGSPKRDPRLIIVHLPKEARWAREALEMAPTV